MYALATAVENAARVLSLNEVQQSLIYAEILRCVAAESKITVLTSWFLNYYFAWLSDDQISEGHADVNHALIAAAAAIVNNLGGQAGREQPLMRECFQAFEPIVPREFWPRHEKGGGYHAAIARTLWANYQVYQTIALDAHAIAHLRLIGREAGQTQRQPKWQAAKAWERCLRMSRWSRTGLIARRLVRASARASRGVAGASSDLVNAANQVSVM